MYVCYLAHSTATKNKLEEDFFQYLQQIDRIAVPVAEVEELKKDILNVYDLKCQAHPRCTPVAKHFYKGHSKEDFHLSGANAIFHLLKTK